MRKEDRSSRSSTSFIALVIAVTLGLPTLASAQGEDEGSSKGTRYYVTGLAGGAWGTGTAAGQTLADGSFTGSSKDSTPYGGAALGVILDLGWSDLRLEIEGTGGRSFTFAIPATSGTYLATTDTWTMQGNFWFEYSLGRLFPDTPIVRHISPFAGGGLGLSRTTLAASNGTAAGSSDSSTLAWQAGGGLSYQASPWLGFELRYQYADLGGPSVALRSGGVPQGDLEIDLGTHEMVAGVRLTFSEL